MPRFFISCQPQLEQDLINELESFWHLLIDLDGLPTRSRPEVVYEDVGGVEIECESHLGFQINLFSKLANRVLWRVHHFEARYFDQFEKELKKFDLKKFFGEQKFNLHIESSKSRLFHESNLEESAQKILKNSTVKTDDSLLSLYVRIFKDNVILSLDTSGKHLHKRGYRKEQGEAPIRETLAAKMYNFLLKNAEAGLVEYSPQSQTTTILDPFCGAGTLLFEAASFFQPNLVTKFDFERFTQLPGLLKSDSWKKNFKIPNPFRNNLFGVELDAKTFVKLQNNLLTFKEYFPGIENDFVFMQGDSKSLDLPALVSQNVIAIANPPYGERLKNTDAEDILMSLERLPNLKGVVVVHPASWKLQFTRLKIKQSENFNNQGLDLKLTLFAL